MKLKTFINKNKKDLIWFVSMFSILIALRVFLFSPVTVSGESMMPTLVDREKMIASKVSTIERFDIIPFKSPDKPGKNYIKRVIGLPGDKIEYKDDVLYVNGKAYEEPYLDEYKSKVDTFLTEDFSLESLYGVSEVPENTYFVLGDNRQNSNDSRAIGFIEKEEILGVSKVSLWPLDKLGLH
ncbi:signal peptidase I [Vagococcus hydrophili]|uniref:Signal peptidase I n=2 Tax=Vagococcus hydrophili TaxID=2714947 RepID=A0A6G8ASN1_9ENTE|nr:signal peptidase I [Vagococcus hydrophili]QIL47935.1 signal peptidase I [Vagococcus hydrophili]